MILSLVPIQEAGRMSILSKEWRFISILTYYHDRPKGSSIRFTNQHSQESSSRSGCSSSCCRTGGFDYCEDLSIGGRLTLLKLVLDTSDRKITWAAWDKVLASKKNEGLGVSSFFALNRALLLNGFGVLFLKMVLFGVGLFKLCMRKALIFGHIAKSVLGMVLTRGSGLIVGLESLLFIYNSLVCLLWNTIKLTELQSKLDLISLSHSRDRWFCDLMGDGEFQVEE
nr:hypothetical protein [Tanacetum cinerariifolium]